MFGCLVKLEMKVCLSIKSVKMYYIFGLSTNWSLRPSESRLSVRTSVCPSAALFLGNRSLLFSETLLLVRACKREKNVPSAFLIIFTVLAILAKNWSKLAIWLDVCNSLFKGWKSLKNLKVGVFGTDFKQVPFVFRQTTCTYSESWGPVEKFFWPPHPGGRGGYKNDQNTQIWVKNIFPKNIVSLFKIDFG